MASLLITLILWLLIIAIVWWIVSHLPLPEPFRWVAVVVVGLLAIVMLLSLMPGSGLHWPALR